MRTAKSKFVFSIAAIVLFGTAMASFAQAPFNVTFDGPPVQPRGTAYGVTDYYESGVVFTTETNTPGSQFTRNGGGISFDPDDGTAYLQPGSTGVLFGFTNGLSFSPVSVDLADYSDSFFDFSIDFIGYRSDGSVVTNSFSGSGLDFQTYYFGPDFTNLIQVDISNGEWSLDNLVVQADPPVLSIAMVGFLQFFPPSTYAIAPTPSLSFPTISNQSYALEFSPDLSPGSWTVLPGIDQNSDPASNMLGDGGLIQLVDTNAVTAPQRFYRVRILQ